MDWKQARRSDAQLRVGFLQRGAGLEASHNGEPPDGTFVQPVAIAPQDLLRANGNGHVPGLPDLQSGETAGAMPMTSTGRLFSLICLPTMDSSPPYSRRQNE